MKSFNGFGYGDLISAIAIIAAEEVKNLHLLFRLPINSLIAEVACCDWDERIYTKEVFNKHLEEFWAWFYNKLAPEVGYNPSQDARASEHQGPLWLLEHLEYQRPTPRGIMKAQEFLVAHARQTEKYV